MKILLRRDSILGHTRATVFMGEPEQTMKNCGQLTMTADEYAVLRSALWMAAAQPLFPHEIEIREAGDLAK